MIREAQIKEKVFYFNYFKKLSSHEVYHGKIFVNDENFLHNDVDAARSSQGFKSVWYWNGHWVE